MGPDYRRLSAWSEACDLAVSVYLMCRALFPGFSCSQQRRPELHGILIFLLVSFSGIFLLGEDALESCGYEIADELFVSG